MSSGSDQRYGPFTAAEAMAIMAAIGIGDEDVVLVGGQCLNFWGTRSRCPDLDAMTSQDMDFLGRLANAEAIAAKLGGDIFYPPPESQTPEIAVIEAHWNGKRLRIDCLGSLYGPANSAVRKQALRVTDPTSGTGFAIMHPVHMLESRLYNVAGNALRRWDEHSVAQLRAAVIIVRDYIAAALERTGADTRACLTMIEAVLDMAVTDQAFDADMLFDVDIGAAVPFGHPALPDAFTRIRAGQFHDWRDRERLRFAKAKEKQIARLDGAHPLHSWLTTRLALWSRRIGSTGSQP